MTNRKLVTSENNKDGGGRKQQLLGRHGSDFFFFLFTFTGFAVTFITGVIMCKVKLKGFSVAFKSV